MTQRRPSRQKPPAGTGPGMTVAGPTRPRLSHSQTTGRRYLTKQGSAPESLRPVREGSKTRVSCEKRGIPTARLSHAAIVRKRASAARNTLREANLRGRELHYAAASLVALLQEEDGCMRGGSSSLHVWQVAVRRLRRAVVATERWLTMPEIVALAETVRKGEP